MDFPSPFHPAPKRRGRSRLALQTTTASLAALALAACGSGSGGDADAAGGGDPGYPDQEITIVVPFAAGGPTDTVTRLIGEPMSKSLGQQIIIKNVGGAGGTLGANQVAKAKGDGYTVLMHHIGMSTAPALYPKLSYDPQKDFKPIGLVTNVPMTIIAKKDFPAKTLEELTAYVKANSKKLAVAERATARVVSFPARRWVEEWGMSTSRSRGSPLSRSFDPRKRTRTRLGCVRSGHEEHAAERDDDG